MPPSPASAGGAPRDACVTTAAELVSRVDSRTAASGDPFAFVTVDPVAAHGSVPAVPAGTRGYGIVAFADHAHGGGQPGRVLLEPRYLQLPGRHLAATADPIAGDASVAGSTRDAPGALAYLPAFGVVITGYNVVHRGREIAIEPGTTFRIVLGDDVASGKCALD